MPGRTFSAGSAYRYGFNGKEQDSAINGSGVDYDYGFRVYDARIGKFLSVDPLRKSYPWYSPYQFAGNSPIKFIDLDGLEPTDPGTKEGQVYQENGNRAHPAGKTWYWHEGSTTYGTKSGWYFSKKYQKVLTPIARDLAGYERKFSTAANTPLDHNWTEAEKANVANTHFGEFIGKGLTGEATAHLIASAQNYANKRNLAVSGYLQTASFNVEDMLLVGIVFKEGVKAIGSVILRNIAERQVKVNLTRNIALGVSEHLDDFAKSIGGITHETWGTEDFPKQFMDVISDPLNRIHFNLTGPDGSKINVWNAITDGSKGLNSQKVTNWELYQLYINPEAQARTTFYFGDKVVPNPFQ